MIALDQVTKTYPGDVKALKGISLRIKKGEFVFVVGQSGSGKTTLFKLLLKEMEPTSGTILVDDKPLTESRAAAFAKCIGYVPQAPFLFPGTLAENIAFSHWGKQWDEKLVRDACRRASIDFVDTHPMGLSQPIGENGVGLSGGQAQRVSIARAMYTNPSIMIFDEATSALDNESEKVVQDSLEKLAKNRTTFVIAHRLSTIKNAQRILVLTEEGIAEEGTHEELLEKGGVYEKLYQMQFHK